MRIGPPLEAKLRGPDSCWRKPERPLMASVRSIQDDPEVTVVLNAGADVSVLPLSFKGVGRPPLSRTSTLRDKGGLMRGGL